jgi:hypothetical protein
MKRLVLLIAAGISLLSMVGLGLAWNARGAVALPPSNAGAVTPATQDQIFFSQDALNARPALTELNRQARISLADSHLLQAYAQPAPTNTPAYPLPAPTNTPAYPLPVQPTNTPAAPGDHNRSMVYQIPPSLAVASPPEQPQETSPVADYMVQDDEHAQQALQLAQSLRQAGVRFPVTNRGMSTTERISPQSPSETCVTVLSNPEMDVIEYGDGTGSVDYWSIVCQKVYYDNDPGYYVSPYHSLVMVDDNDPYCVNTTDNIDADAFGQGFKAPSNLTRVRVDYSRLYANENSNDDAYGRFYALDAEGYLDELIGGWNIGTTPSGWSNRYLEITDASDLADLEGKNLALLFELWSYISSSASYQEVIWLDDAQVTLCFETGPHAVYLPMLIRQPAPELACVPYEPDGLDQRGSTVVGVTCSGSFGATDMKDYYTLNLNGVTNVRLQLTNLPSGTNWDAMIYEDATGYPLACHIGTPGDQDKFKDCDPLSLSKTYFVLVSAGTAPGSGANTYQMSVVQR